jgi:hypothetical protein
MDTTTEKFHFAAIELVQSNSVKQRLAAAYRRHLAALNAEHLPRDNRESFAAVMRALTCVRPLPGEDAIAASVRKMSDAEAAEHATVIIEIFAALSRAEGANHKTAGTANGSVVQLYPIESADHFAVPSIISRA